jgi:pSer/pThr/pTyr-binding forkhead associated (FHA) protein
MYLCTQGHQSTEPDYCSDCGMRINANPVATPSVAAAAAGAAEICPDCAETRNGGSQYCENCRYDFVNHCSYGQAAPAQTAQPIPPAPSFTSSPAAVDSQPFATMSTTVLANVELVVDPSMVAGTNLAGQCPQNEPVRVFPLDLEENLVGRRSDVKGVYPEIPVDDPGVSRRHLKLIRQPDGQYAALDLGSTNGSILNGETLAPGILTPLKMGDEISLGSWTKLRLTAKH